MSGRAHDDAAVEAAGAQQRRIEHIGPVGRGDQDHAFVGFEAVHFDQQRVQRLLAFVVSAAQAGAAMAADGVNFIDEDDAGRVLLALLEQVAHAAGADADKHLDEIRAGDGEERNVGFAGDGPRQQRLARARRADQQHALGNAPAELLELLRVLQEFDDFLQLFLGFVGSGDILERGLFLLRRQQARARFAEAQRLVSAGLHLAHHEDPERHQQKQRRRIQQESDPVGAIDFLDVDQNLLVAQRLGQIGSGFLENRGAEFLGGLAPFAFDFVAVGGEVQRDFLDVAAVHLRHELAVAGFFFAGRLAALRDQRPEQDAQHDDEQPKHYGL